MTTGDTTFRDVGQMHVRDYLFSLPAGGDTTGLYESTGVLLPIHGPFSVCVCKERRGGDRSSFGERGWVMGQVNPGHSSAPPSAVKDQPRSTVVQDCATRRLAISTMYMHTNGDIRDKGFLPLADV